jgi:hypothetical protein
MKLKFSYSLETEMRRAKYAIDNYKKYHDEQHRNVSLPKNYKNLNSTQLSEQIKSELNFYRAKSCENFIQERWKIDKPILDNYFNRIPCDKPSVINVELSNYGIGGHYIVPNNVLLRFQHKALDYETFIHELTHCLIEKDVVQKYKLTSFEKESLVAWLMISDKGLMSLFWFLDYTPGYNGPVSKELFERIGWENIK